MTARLYVTSLSHPSKAATAMVSYKRLPYRRVNLLAGFHPMLVRAAGFQGRTVPALELDGRHVQGSLEISRALDEAIAERPLFPPEPFARRSVEDAERWGNDELQPIPRRIFRWAVVRDRALRRWVAADVTGVPAPRVMAALTKPVAARRSADAGGDEGTVREDVSRLPGLLDHVDALVGSGVIGTDQPNAADFQILSSVRVLLDFKALPAAEERPSAQRARRLFPYWEGEMPYFELP
jgi:glutathione S-transferase